MQSVKHKPTEHDTLAVCIETFGCQMNVLDSQLVAELLGKHGYVTAASPKDADVVLLNTCSVRQLAEQKVWSRLGRLGVTKKEERPNLMVGVIGCMAERLGKQLCQKMPHIQIVCGPSMLHQLPAMLEIARAKGTAQVSVSGFVKPKRTKQTRPNTACLLDSTRSFGFQANSVQAYVRITQGCNKFCSFCVVPFVRGPEVHKSPEDVLHEVKQLVQYGAKEVTLIGQTVNHYVFKSQGRTTSFADLLWLIHEQVPELPRLRFVTSFPKHFDNAALDVMAAAPRICRYLHLPAQSGSNRILKAMNRGYCIEEYVDLLERARTRLKDVCISGDMIVGFPTETSQDHEASIRLLEKAQYKSCFVFKYSERVGTLAAKKYSEDVPEPLKKQRNKELLEVQARAGLVHNQQHVGKNVMVLVEGASKLRAHQKRGSDARFDQSDMRDVCDNAASVPCGDGSEESSPLADNSRLIGRTQGDEIVAFDGPSSVIGQMVDVHIGDVTPLTLLGTMYDQ